MAEAVRPSHRRTITISTVVSILAIVGVILPVVGAIASPWLIGVMSNAMAGEIQQRVQHHVAPVNAAMKVLIEGQIAAIEDDIASMEFRRDRAPETWSEADDRELRAKQRRLTSHREALTAMDQAGRRPR